MLSLMQHRLPKFVIWVVVKLHSLAHFSHTKQMCYDGESDDVALCWSTAKVTSLRGELQQEEFLSRNINSSK